MSDEPEQGRKEEGLYELGPDVRPVGPVTSEPAQPPVPENPVHACPACDYLLTGLTTRRCPECGRPFTLVEARRRAEELNPTPELARDFRAIQWERTQLTAGAAAFAVGYLVPLLFSGRFGTWFLLSELALVLLMAGIYWHYSQTRLPMMVMVVGLTLAGLNVCWLGMLISVL